MAVACQGAVSASAAGSNPDRGELQTPVSYRGSLPCPGCADAPAQLDLWPDGTFHLDRSAGAGVDGSLDEIGRWRRDPDAAEILLYGGHEAPLRMQIVDSRTLRALDTQGQPAGRGDEFDLRTDGSSTPADLSLRLHGMFTYLAGAPRFEECLTGRWHPVAQEQDYPALEREYLALPKPTPGSPVLASFDAAIEQRPRMAGSGTGQTVIVRRLTGLWPAQTCERAMNHASLANQYWRVDRLRGERVAPIDEAQGDVFVILRGDQGGYVANAGCGRYSGTYRVGGATIAFDPPVGLPDCLADLRGRQQTLLDTMAAARTWAIHGQVLELFDAAGASLAALEAVYLR